MALSDQIIDHIPALRRYGRALAGSTSMADDLVQDTLERALSRFILWKPKSQLRPWLFTIMHNLWVNRQRAERRYFSPFDDCPEQPAAENQTSHMVMKDLIRCLDQLPADQRETLLLVAVEAMSYAEVAAITGVPIGTVMSRLKRGRDRLAKLLEGEVAPYIRQIK